MATNHVGIEYVSWTSTWYKTRVQVLLSRVQVLAKARGLSPHTGRQTMVLLQ